MWQLYHVHNYYYYIIISAVKPIDISILILFKLSTRIHFVCILEYH